MEQQTHRPLTRRQLLFAGLTTGVAVSLTTDHLRRQAEQQRTLALEAIAESQLDTDSLLTAAFQQNEQIFERLRQLQATVPAFVPPIPYNRELSKVLIICNKLTTQQYIKGKIDPTYDGTIPSLPAFNDRLRDYRQIASFQGPEDQDVQEVEISRPANLPLDQASTRFQQQLDRAQSRIEDTIQEVVELKRTIPVYFGFVLESDDHFLVLFRGTQRQVEWLENITALHEAYSDSDSETAYGAIHTGFRSTYRQLTQPLPLDVMRQLDPTKPCYVSGHSLGAAIATLATVDAALQIPALRPYLRLYTYASPRVGDVDFAKTVHQLIPNSYRIVNLADVVPLVPPTELDGVYTHVGQRWAFLSQNDDVLPNHQIDIYRYAIEQEAEQQAINAYANLPVI